MKQTTYELVGQYLDLRLMIDLELEEDDAL